MGEPPSDGAVKVISMEPSPGMALKLVGAPGTARVVRVTALEAGPAPTELTARK